MKISTMVTLGVLGVLVLVGVGSANGLVGRDEAVNQTYAQVQNVMQRQAELIPNLVETVKGMSQFEKETLTAVTEARAKAAGVINIDPAKIAADPALQKQFMEAQQGLSASLGRLLLVNERYPELKANQGYLNLMTELSGSINRVAVERRRNQLAVESYNSGIRVFPTVVVAKVLGYQARPYFAADASAQRAPTVNFGK